MIDQEYKECSGNNKVELLLRLWGKLESSDAELNKFHPAVFHMLDVGNVAKALLGAGSSPRWKSVLANTLGEKADTLVDWLPWIVALHDIGKISAPFQEQNEIQRVRLASEGFSFGNRRWNGVPHHSLVSQASLGWESGDWGFPKRFLRMWRDGAGGHHGRFTSNAEIRDALAILKREPPEWKLWRLEASEKLKSCLFPYPPVEWKEPSNISSATMTLTGFMILCDWLGSDQTHFPACSGMSYEDYAVRSEEQARRAVQYAGFNYKTVSDSPTDFERLFPVCVPARPLQKAIDLIPDEVLGGAVLAIIEAPTGEGKTEAALALAHKIAMLRGSDEFYYALPTTATSNQMFGRVKNYLEKGLKLPTGVKLIHGQAFLYEDDLELKPLSNGESTAERASLEWFGPKKRALLAPFGVGTIDQAELAALNVKHNALRMIGLAGKVLILDEVHAYDVYMSTIIERLLSWLAAMGTSVILLSATLPQGRRSRLTQAFGDRTIGHSTGADNYPALWILGEKGIFQTFPPAFQTDRTIHVGHLRFREDEAIAKADWLLDQVKNGGCACWITNTVQRAQDIYQAVRGRIGDEADVALIHGRFPVEDRQKLEDQIRQYYGPGREKRPARGIVIGTQVLEQSLDLDFDVMVSDLAPIDLILQRSGRLHRHLRARPSAHTEPHLWINYKLDEGILNPGVDALIYDEYILRLTQLILQGQSSIILPTDYRRLVEGVYSAEEPDPGTTLYTALLELRRKELASIEIANTRLMPLADADDPFCGPAAHLGFEESETKVGWAIAQTRLGEESLNVIPLETDGERVWITSQGQRYDVTIEGSITRVMQLRLLHRSLRVSHRGVVEALRQAVIPSSFARSALIKDHVPLFLKEGKLSINWYGSQIMMELDPDLGLCICVQKRS